MDGCGHDPDPLAIRIATEDVQRADVAALRAFHQRRKRTRKTIGTVELVCARLAALCSEIAEHARRHDAADGASCPEWFEVRGAGAKFVARGLPLTKWADKAVSRLELVRFVVPVTAPSSLQGKAIDVSLAPAIAGVFLPSVPLQLVIAFIWMAAAIIALFVMFDVCPCGGSACSYSCFYGPVSCATQQAF